MITSVDEFVRLCISEDRDEYRRVKTDDVSEDILSAVLSKFPELVDCVIHSNSVTVQILETLAKSPEAHVRAGVATKRKLSPDLFELLSKDTDPSVRARIAYNRKTPIHLIRRLALDEYDFVAQAAQQRLLQH